MTIPNQHNVDFILEEALTTYYIREQFSDFLTTLANPIAPRLLAYHGGPLFSDMAIYKLNILPKNSSINKRTIFNQSMYNIEKRILIMTTLHSRRYWMKMSCNQNPSQDRWQPQHNGETLNALRSAIVNL